MLVLHIAIAIVSLAAAAWLLVRPSAWLLRAQGGLVAGTVASGTYVAVTTHAHLASACTAGLTYLSFTAASALVARARLAAHAQQ